jgi:acyl carrier protein
MFFVREIAVNHREQVRDYLLRILRDNKSDVASLADADLLVSSGRLSSLDVVDLLTFLEEKFNFEIDPIDFDQSKFDSVDSIVAMLESAGAGGGISGGEGARR